MKVQGVVCIDSRKDITKWINAAADEFDFAAVGFLAGAIAESNLKEQAAREGAWPDVSYGLYQPAVKWLGREASGLERAADGTVLDTPQNRRRARDLCWDAAWLIQYTAPRYATLLARWGDPLEAWCRWNKPNLPGSENPSRANYERGLREAEGYRMGATVGPGIKAKMDEVGDEPVTNEWTEDTGAGKVAKAWGTKGLYIASPDSGSWQVAGPFAGVEA
jgi:hypothetical protein